MNSQIQTTLLEIFDNASSELPADGTRIGVLELDALVSETMSFLGGGPREIALQFLKANLESAPVLNLGGECRQVVCYVNSVSWTVILDSKYDDTDEDEDFSMRLVNSMEGGSYTFVDAPTLDQVLDRTMKLMEDNVKCKGCCSQTLAANFGVCVRCQSTWNTVPCTVCQHHFGVLNAAGQHRHH